jgi:hypothetical protein
MGNGLPGKKGKKASKTLDTLDCLAYDISVEGKVLHREAPANGAG